MNFPKLCSNTPLKIHGNETSSNRHKIVELAPIGVDGVVPVLQDAGRDIDRSRVRSKMADAIVGQMVPRGVHPALTSGVFIQ